MLEALFVVIVICCLAGVVIWGADKYLTLPAPFAFVKNIAIFVFIVIVCVVLFDALVGHHWIGARTLR